MDLALVTPDTPAMAVRITVQTDAPDVANASTVAASAWQGGVVLIAPRRSAVLGTVIVIFLTHVSATRDGWERFARFRWRVRIRLVIRMVIVSLAVVIAKEDGKMISVVHHHLNVNQHAHQELNVIA